MTRGRILEHLRAVGEPQTVTELAAALDVHPNTVRFHLRRLVAAGQVTEAPGARDGRGRPGLVFSATGRMDPAGPTRYRLLAEVLLESLGTGADARQRATSAGRTIGRRLAAVPTAESGTPVDRLHALLDDVGFAPEPVEGGQIRLRHCPFLDVATSPDRIVCAAHLGLMQGALDEFGAGVTVERLDPLVEPDLCVTYLETRRASA